jgi:hypothetical protein
VFVIGMCAYASVAMFLPGLLAPVPDAGPIRVAGFEAIQVEGHWVENVVAGPIYVVSGALHDTGGTRPAAGSVLRVRLLDERSGAVVAESAAVGPPIPTVRLRESNPRDLRAVQERGAAAILEQPLARRKRRPFMAVLTDIPPGAVAFELQVAEASSAPPDLVGAFDTERELDGAAAGALAEEGMAAKLPAVEAELPAPEAAATEPAQAR